MKYALAVMENEKQTRFVLCNLPETFWQQGYGKFLQSLILKYVPKIF